MNEPGKHVDELAHAVIGAAIEVHRHLGPGFLESIYEEAMRFELGRRGIPFESQKETAVSYKGQLIGRHKMDLLVGGSLIVELKAVDALAEIHKAQLISYLRATGLALGLLINFNVPVLKQGIQRVVYTTNRYEPPGHQELQLEERGLNRQERKEHQGVKSASNDETAASRH